MDRMYIKTFRVCAAVIALIAWLGISLQFNTLMQANLSKGRTWAGSLLEFLSYFTIQSNLLIAIALTVIAVTPSARVGFFKRPGVLAAITVYISIVSLVYNIVLRPLVHFTGLDKLGDEIVHLIVPVLYVIYWITAVMKNNITFKNSFTWLLYPLIYLIYILIRGALCGIYPYFFLDAGKFGYSKVLINIAVLMLVFIVFNTVYVFIAKLIRLTNQVDTSNAV